MSLCGNNNPCPDLVTGQKCGITYTGARYVPLFADPAEWSSSNAYEPLTIVIHEGNSYTSKTFVPVGVDISNDQYWALTGNYNAQVEAYRQEVISLKTKYDKKLNLFTTVEDFGAVGDGVVDDTMAIQNALNSGSNYIYFPKIYKISDSLKIVNPVTIYGNEYSSITQTKENTPILLAEDVSNILIKSLTFIGLGTDFKEEYGRTADGILFKGNNTRISNISILNCTFLKNSANGIFIENVDNYNIENNKVVGTSPLNGVNYQFGINVYNTSNGLINNNNISKTSHGLYVGSEDNNIIISNNNINNITGQHGMYITSENLINIYSNIVHDIALQGIKLQFDANQTKDGIEANITNNTIYNTVDSAILITVVSGSFRFKNINVNSNNIYNHGGYSISINNTDNIKINGNFMSGGTKSFSALNIISSKYVSITSNSIQNFKQNGIEFGIGAEGNQSENIVVSSNNITDIDNANGVALYVLGVVTDINVFNNQFLDQKDTYKYAIYIADEKTTAKIVNNYLDNNTRLNNMMTSLTFSNNIYKSGIDLYPNILTPGFKANEFTANEAPTVGNFYVGDVVWNSLPTNENNVGWVCVSSSPLTWKTF